MQQVVVVASASLFFFFTAFLSGMLSDSLLARTRDLAEANAMIEAQNIKLESRIADRTREIAAQNVLLQRQNERIVEANRLKTEYLLNINHELRTPLTSILGYGRMLLDRQIEPERQREFVKSMVAQANVLNSFVSSLNQIEDIESGVTMLQRSQVRLSDLVDEAIITLRPRFEERGLKIPPCLSDGPDLAASVDPEKIRQVLLNLLENALRVTPRGGRIAISIERSEDQLRVGVHDNGPGIHAEYLECVFERFKQLDESYSRLRGGLGLGLSLVRSIVELHGGKSWAESPGRLSQDAEEGNRGASFYFTIPVKAPAEKGTESASV
jgi:hypothetical protein